MRLDRLLGILTVLLQNGRVTAPSLAEKFEVSRRTIGRDIDALCLAGIPIVTHQGGGGGVSIAEGFKLDFNAHFYDNINLVALFDPSVKYQLIETYGLHCYTETEDGLLRLEIGYTNRDHLICWLLGFGGKVKVLEPEDIARAVREAAEKIIAQYK